ncbi:hypothetical protein [Yoonia sp. 2307UL14-13]|uniref:hypothetical protein n=1 Tax=Yoonia sp. 2307UL14-13 TaxID=3126506 RepID=UPI0030AB7EF4
MYSMCTLCVRGVLVLLLIAGLLIPRMSAVIADVIPSIQTMVICTGEGLITLTIGPEGEPIEVVENQQHPCVMSEGVTFATVAIPFWQKLAADYFHAFAIRENTRILDDHLIRLALTRAPPVVT